MVCRGALFFLGNHHRFALGAHENLVLGALKIVHIHQTLVAARGEQRRFVHQIRQISTRHARRATRNNFGFDIRRNRYLAHMHQQNLLAAADIRQRHDHLTVKATRTQQRRIKHIRTVGRSDHNNPDVGLEAIHLHQ